MKLLIILISLFLIQSCASRVLVRTSTCEAIVKDIQSCEEVK